MEESLQDPNQISNENPASVSTAQAQELVITQEMMDDAMLELKKEQNYFSAIMSGLGAAIIGALIWAVITVATKFQIGYMAVAVGILVGYAVRTSGKGIDPAFGVIGGVLALVGCLLGNFFSAIGFFANTEGVGYFETLVAIDLSYVPDIIIETFQPMDILFYGIAIYEGYKFSMRKITDNDLMSKINPSQN